MLRLAGTGTATYTKPSQGLPQFISFNKKDLESAISIIVGLVVYIHVQVSWVVGYYSY